MNVGGGREAAVIARTKCELINFRQCGDVLYVKRFPLKLKGAVCKSYVRSEIPYCSEVWCKKERF